MLATGLVLPPAAQAAKRGRDGQIAYSVSVGNDSQIARKNGDGSGPVTPVTPLARFFDPSWSPDGARIAAEDTTSGIVIFGANGGPIVNLTATPTDRDPAWSPDGHYVAFTRAGEIYMVPVDLSTGPINLVPGVGPDWSSDGHSIAYTDPTTGTLYTVEVFPGLGTPIPRTPAGAVYVINGNASVVSWSPNRAKIAYITGGPTQNLAYVTLQNLAETVINGTAGARAPDWSPDGRRIAYQLSGGGISTTPTTNGTITTISNTGGDPSWEACRYSCRHQ